MKPKPRPAAALAADDATTGADLLHLLERPAWHQQAACRGEGPDRYYPPAGMAHPPETCATCPVRTQCAEAGADDEHGIWGGITARQRRTNRERARRREVQLRARRT